MAVAPQQFLPPESQPWARWVTDQLRSHDVSVRSMRRTTLALNKGQTSTMDMASNQRRLQDEIQADLDLNTEILNAAREQLDELVEVDLPQLALDLAGNTLLIEELENVTLPALRDELDTATDELGTLQDITLPALQNDLDALDDVVAQHTLEFEALEQLPSDLAALGTRLDSAETELGGLDDALGVLNNTTLPGIVNDLQTQIDNIEVDGDGNTITTSTNAPSTTAGYSEGDQWRRVIGTGSSRRIIGEWYFSGTAWVQTTIDNDVIEQIDAAKITTGYLNAARIEADSIVGEKIAANAITGNKILAGSITAADAVFANAAIVNADIANLNAEKITAGFIASERIAADSITTDKIAADAITANEIATNAITADKINANAVTANKIATDAVTAVNINANAVTTAKIAADAVTAEKIEAGAITTVKLAANAVTAEKIAADTITGNEIKAGSITAADAVFANAAIVSANIDSIVADKIVGGTIRGITIEGVDITGTSTITSGGTLTVNGNINVTGGNLEISRSGVTTFSARSNGITLSTPSTPDEHLWIAPSTGPYGIRIWQQRRIGGVWNGIASIGIGSQVAGWGGATTTVGLDAANAFLLGGTYISGQLMLGGSPLSGVEPGIMVEAGNYGFAERVGQDQSPGWFAQPSGISRTRTAEWSIPSTGDNTIPLNSTTSSHGWMVASGAGAQARQKGVYTIHATVQFDGSSANYWRNLNIAVNGSRIASTPTVASSNSRSASITVAHRLNRDDVVTLTTNGSSNSTGMKVNANILLKIERTGV